MPQHSSLPKHTTKILAVAPYEGMKNLMLKLAARRNDIDLDVVVGDLEQGVELFLHHLHPEHEVVISRGCTSQKIKEVCSIPVVEVSFSQYDILRVIKLSETYTRKYALVGSPTITQNAQMLCELLQYHIDIFTSNSEDELPDLLSHVKALGYEMILCDVSANREAKNLNLNALLITSGTESISAAFDEAVRISLDHNTLQSEKLFLMDVLQHSSDRVIILNRKGELFFSTADELDFELLSDHLRSSLSIRFEKQPQKFFLDLDGTQYSFTCKYLTYQGEDYAVFYYSKTAAPVPTSKFGIQYFNQQETEDVVFSNFFSMTNANRSVRTMVDSINTSNVPVMIFGEEGTGKEQVARIIYTRSSFAKSPMVTINCPLLNERGWEFLIDHHNSPLMDNGNTIFFQDISLLSQEQRSVLLSVMMDTNLKKRNRLLFSCRCSVGQGIPEEAVEFINTLNCVTLHLPALREHTGEIPALAGMYMSILNGSMENQVIGFEPRAMELLQRFDWPYNYTQFKRLLNELALAAKTPFIQAEAVAGLLKEEQKNTDSEYENSLFDEDNPQNTLDLSRSLKDITRDVIELVLQQHNGNQSAAAKQLGIGRSTLWRYLK